MTPSPSPTTHAPRVGPAGLGRHLRPPADPPGGTVAALARRDLVVVATTIVALAAVLSGSLLWVTAVLLLGAMILGGLQVLGDDDGPVGERGVPIESLFLPAVAAIGCLGAIRLVPLGLAIAPALVLVGLLVRAALSVEARIASAGERPSDGDRSRALVAILVVALVAFTGVAAIVPGGIAGLEPAGAPVRPLPIGDLALLALADAVIAGLLGYRTAALRDATARDATWAALTYATAIAIGAAALRAMGIPRLIGPALLMLLFYLWDSLHATPPARRRDARFIWETVVLAGLGAVVVFWNVRLIG
ncbi:MAG TPA: hypothetical protein VFK35_03020 [Candidatus Limnocylindrales bacterium]|nr:hypothetical protein [Candidatus Limnocylindrales bacterium]